MASSPCFSCVRHANQCSRADRVSRIYRWDQTYDHVRSGSRRRSGVPGQHSSVDRIRINRINSCQSASSLGSCIKTIGRYVKQQRLRNLCQRNDRSRIRRFCSHRTLHASAHGHTATADPDKTDAAELDPDMTSQNIHPLMLERHLTELAYDKDLPQEQTRLFGWGKSLDTVARVRLDMHNDKEVDVFGGIKGELVSVKPDKTIPRRVRRRLQAHVVNGMLPFVCVCVICALMLCPTAVHEPSEHRRKPFCPHFGTCGSCHLQHIDPVEQRRLKQAVLVRELEEVGVHAVHMLDAIYDEKSNTGGYCPYYCQVDGCFLHRNVCVFVA